MSIISLSIDPTLGIGPAFAGEAARLAFDRLRQWLEGRSDRRWIEMRDVMSLSGIHNSALEVALLRATAGQARDKKIGCAAWTELNDQKYWVNTVYVKSRDREGAEEDFPGVFVQRIAPNSQQPLCRTDKDWQKIERKGKDLADLTVMLGLTRMPKLYFTHIGEGEILPLWSGQNEGQSDDKYKGTWAPIAKAMGLEVGDQQGAVVMPAAVLYALATCLAAAWYEENGIPPQKKQGLFKRLQPDIPGFSPFKLVNGSYELRIADLPNVEDGSKFHEILAMVPSCRVHIIPEANFITSLS